MVIVLFYMSRFYDKLRNLHHCIHYGPGLPSTVTQSSCHSLTSVSTALRSLWTLHRLLPWTLVLLSFSPSIQLKEREQSDFFMSSTGQLTSSSSNIRFIVDDALAEYTKITGIDLANNPFAAALEQSNSPEAILQLLQGREKDFREYRDGDRRLISCLSPAVKVLQALSGIMGEAAALVSHTCNLRSHLTLA